MFIVMKDEDSEDERAYKNRVNDFFLSSVLSQADKEDEKEMFEILDIKPGSQDSDKENTE